jgi:2-polyprenyl-6-methoxyphenol hydroxylase-like FAD-dependent oxidoreductase
VPDSQLFVVPIRQQGLVQVLTERADEYGTEIRWGHALTGFDDHDEGITVHVAGPDGAYDLMAQYVVGADGGHSKTRHLAGIQFPGMSSYDLVVRIGFNLVPPDEWVEPVSDAGGSDHLPPQRFHRTDRGVFAYGERIAELARDGRPLLVDLTEGEAIATAVTDIADQLTLAAGRPVGEIAATAVLVRPDGYVAWASSQAMPDPDELRELRAVLTHWFGI